MLESDLTFYLQVILKKHLPRIRFELTKVETRRNLQKNEMDCDSEHCSYQVTLYLKPSEIHPQFPIEDPHKLQPELSGQRTLGIYNTNGSLNVPFLKENADLLFQAGEYTLAKRIYQVLVQSGERGAILYYRMGLCFEAEGKLEEACQRYHEAVQVYPNLEIYYRWAEVLKRQSKNQQAAEVLERARSFKTRIPFLN